jgi:hypothetical protein
MSVNLDSKEIANVSINCEIKSSVLHVNYDLIEFFMIGTRKDAVISIQNIDTLASVEHTVINDARFETNRT